MWPTEVIPDSDSVFMRVHRCFLDTGGNLIPGVFRDHGVGMSADWEKYSTPQGTQARATRPGDNGVIALHVGRVRGVPGLTVEHKPDMERNNRAHSNVIGDKRTPEVRLKLLRIAEWRTRVP